MSIKLPKNQILWLTYNTTDGKPQYVVTSDVQRTKYILHKVDEDGGLTKVRTSVKPTFKEVGNYE